MRSLPSFTNLICYSSLEKIKKDCRLEMNLNTIFCIFDFFKFLLLSSISSSCVHATFSHLSDMWAYKAKELIIQRIREALNSYPVDQASGSSKSLVLPLTLCKSEGQL